MDSNRKYREMYEKPPFYRHMELYEWADQYQKHKYFTEYDYRAERYVRRRYLKGMQETSPVETEENEWRYRDRYGTLRQNTEFFRLLAEYEALFRGCGSYSEYTLKAVSTGKSVRRANFAIWYMRHCAARFFMYDYDKYPNLDAEYDEWEKTGSKGYPPNPPASLPLVVPFSSTSRHEDYFQFRKLKEMCEEAFANGHSECCGYGEFVGNGGKEKT